MALSIQDRSGAALVVTLAVITLLVAAGLQLARTTGTSVLYTMVQRDAVLARQKARSGIALGRAVLARDAAESQTDSIREAWADPDEMERAVQILGYEPDTLSVTMEDELGKIQVNALIREFPGRKVSGRQREILERFLYLKSQQEEGLAQLDMDGLVNSLIDWLDSRDDDAVTGLSGAENDHYLNLEIPYACANGPVNTLRSLSRVKGYNVPALTGIDFGAFFTVYGLVPQSKETGKFRYQGKINVNTADADVIAALLPEGFEGLATDIVSYRGERLENGRGYANPLDNGWLEKVIELPEKEKKKIGNLVTYASDTFKIICNASENDTRVSLTAWVRRVKLPGSGKWSCDIMQMEQDL